MIASAYGFLFLSVILLWFPGRKKIPSWGVTLLIAVLLGLWTRQLVFSSAVLIAICAISAYYSLASKLQGIKKTIAGVILLLVSIGLATHQFSGFNSLLVLDHIYISPNAVPYTLYLNFDKTIVGIFILGFGCQLITRPSQLWSMLNKIKYKAPAIILVVTVLAYVFGYIRFNPKFPSSLLIWSVTNLLLVCTEEEAFFRGFIQNKLAFIMQQNMHSKYWAVLIASLLFGFAHYVGGIKYILLATVAGIGYGWVYMLTKRIEASILTHFGLNLIHFLFFTYPALASAI